MTDRERLQELYQERAELASYESDVDEAKKYTVVGGFWWRVYDWFGRKFAEYRRDVQDDIDYETGRKP